VKVGLFRGFSEEQERPESSMRTRLLSVACLALLLPNLTQAVEFWHSSTIWAGQGQCTAVFSFDSGLHDITDLRVAVKALSPNGEIVLEGELAIDQFGQSSAERYADAFLEGEAVCAEDLTIEVEEATARLDGRLIDLLATQSLTPRDFRPLPIRF